MCDVPSLKEGTMTCTSPREEKRQFWRQHILAVPGSGLSAAAYCRLHGLQYKNFVYWKRVLPGAVVQMEYSSVLESDFEEITAIVPCGLPRTMTADLGFTALRVEIGGRFRIEVAGDFSPVVFAKLVRTLEELR
jgi:hypothetical protein